MKWKEQQESELPKKMIYADDCDFFTENEKTQKETYEKAKEILTKHNLIVNDDKTEYTIIKREKDKKKEEWRNVKKN